VRAAGGVDVTTRAATPVPGLALVSQDPGRHLLTERVRDEVARLTLMRVPARQRAMRIAATLDEFGLEAMAERHPLDLSVGERERVALAAAWSPTPV